MEGQISHGNAGIGSLDEEPSQISMPLCFDSVFGYSYQSFSESDIDLLWKQGWKTRNGYRNAFGVRKSYWQVSERSSTTVHNTRLYLVGMASLF